MKKYVILPLKNMVLFPGVNTSIRLSRDSSLRIAQEYANSTSKIVVVAQKDDKVEDPNEDDIYRVGVFARIQQIVKDAGDETFIAIKTEKRVRLNDVEVTTSVDNLHVLTASVTVIPEDNTSDWSLEIRSKTLQMQAIRMMLYNNLVQSPIYNHINSLKDPEEIVNTICTALSFDTAEKQKCLETNSIDDRCDKILEFIGKELENLDVKHNIHVKTQEDINKDQRNYYLHHQLETIQKELGEDTGKEQIDELNARAEKKKWPDEVKAIYEKELTKLQRINRNSADYTVQYNYIETLLELPWDEVTTDNFDIAHAQEVLNEDHYGLDKVKERIIEYLAVLKQKGDMKSPILCLYGPPGVGKTSLGKSIARALGREYARISLGGLHDEAEIRGHRRTYVGAMLGRVLQSIKKVKVSNPVFVLDEIDKIGMDHKGDPSSALLEVLDPEQNRSFHDNYLDIDYDLSRVLFVATANSLDSIPRPLLDRMELIEVTGYSMEEKQEIAIRHLVPKQLKEHGLSKDQISFPKPVLGQIIENYTRESGVRSLERTIGTICRKVVTKIALGTPYPAKLSKEIVVECLGKARYSRDMYENNYVGVVTGLAWTSVGGEILFIETSLSAAKQGSLALTGNLGDVMKESATIALAYVKAHASDWSIKQDVIDKTAVHIHVPEGAVPKDGPSAGITITTALVSAFTKRKVRPRIAMTGEMTLRGKVLPIGGVKEKLLAAKRAGITDIVVCEDNRKDVEEIPEMYLKGLTFHYVKDIHEVIDFALM